MKRAFTLIETMIVIAILSILLAVPLLVHNTSGNLTRELSYREASETAELSRELLQGLPFEDLPPRTVTVQPGGVVNLGQISVENDLVQLRWPDGRSAGQANLEEGKLRVAPEWAGRTIVVDYRLLMNFLPGQGESHTVGRDGSLTLSHGPVRRVGAVWLSDGEKLARLTDFRIDGDILRLSPELADRVVTVDYQGEAIRTEVEGRFLNTNLVPQLQTSEYKSIRLTTYYGGRTPVVQGLLKVAP